MTIIIKAFNELTTKELFEIYKLRSLVFVVEQNCVYQDVDEKDLDSFHVMMFDQNKLVGYSRILPPGVSYEEPAIGRVVLEKEKRKLGAGKELMQCSVNKTLELYGNQDIIISAQTYLSRFYRELGFKPEGQGYDEDGIPHIKMRYRPSLN
jgi:ElaA protein